jgi:hypothetical protein
LADAVQAGWPDLPILVISGYTELPPGFVTRFPWLRKPFRESELAAALSDLVHQSATSGVVAFRPRGQDQSDIGSADEHPSICQLGENRPSI